MHSKGLFFVEIFISILIVTYAIDGSNANSDIEISPQVARTYLRRGGFECGRDDPDYETLALICYHDCENGYYRAGYCLQMDSNRPSFCYCVPPDQPCPEGADPQFPCPPPTVNPVNPGC